MGNYSLVNKTQPCINSFYRQEQTYLNTIYNPDYLH